MQEEILVLTLATEEKIENDDSKENKKTRIYKGEHHPFEED